jgi:hypothetical protein
MSLIRDVLGIKFLLYTVFIHPTYLVSGEYKFHGSGRFREENKGPDSASPYAQPLLHRRSFPRLPTPAARPYSVLLSPRSPATKPLSPFQPVRFPVMTPLLDVLDVLTAPFGGPSGLVGRVELKDFNVGGDEREGGGGEVGERGKEVREGGRVAEVGQEGECREKEERSLCTA